MTLNDHPYPSVCASTSLRSLGAKTSLQYMFALEACVLHPNGNFCVYFDLVILLVSSSCTIYIWSKLTPPKIELNTVR